jgi:hypothetical protein
MLEASLMILSSPLFSLLFLRGFFSGAPEGTEDFSLACHSGVYINLSSTENKQATHTGSIFRGGKTRSERAKKANVI